LTQFYFSMLMPPATALLDGQETRLAAAAVQRLAACRSDRGLSGQVLLLDGSCPEIASLQPGALLPAVALATAAASGPAEALAAIGRELARCRALGMPVRTLHLVAHGRCGAFRLGRHWIDAAALAANAAELAGWGLEHLALWSCRAGADGDFVALLEELTAATVWSSSTNLATQPLHGAAQLRPSRPIPGNPVLALSQLFEPEHLASVHVVLADVNLLFETGSIGTIGNNTGQINGAVAFESQGIARIGFFQSDTDNDGLFDVQGNDIPGFIRVYLLDGTSFDVNGAIVWRYPNGGSPDQFGFIAADGVSQSWSYNGSTFTITGGTTANSSTNILLRSFNAASAVATGNISGNAATTGLVEALNATLASLSKPTSITGNSVVEGADLVFNVVLDKAVTSTELLTFSFSGGTATLGDDYTSSFSDYTFTAYDSNGAVIDGGIINNNDGTITLAPGVASFDMIIPTTPDEDPDSREEEDETVILTFGGTVSGTGTIEEANPVCFLSGTWIATPDGPRPVETLQPGDLVLTPEGPEPVRFLGVTRTGQNTLRALGRMPIGIEAGALGCLGPERTTFVSPSHGILLQDALVEAQALLNGTSIRQYNAWPDQGRIAYYAIELQRHALVWANGLLAESFFPTMRPNGVSRINWANYAHYVALYGDAFHPIAELELPRIPFARQLPPAVRELVGAAAMAV
jgi:hypothetical protein